MKILNRGLIITLTTFLLLGCSLEEKNNKGYKTSSLWDFANPHPWQGLWHMYFINSTYFKFTMRGSMFEMNMHGNFEITSPDGDHREIYTCLEQPDPGNLDVFLYEHMIIKNKQRLKRVQYCKLQLFRTENDPEMLCDQIWLAKYKPTLDEAKLESVLFPFATKESMYKFWTRSKYAGIHITHLGIRKFLKGVYNFIRFLRGNTQEGPSSPATSQIPVGRREFDPEKATNEEFLEELEDTKL